MTGMHNKQIIIIKRGQKLHNTKNKITDINKYHMFLLNVSIPKIVNIFAVTRP